MKEIENERRDWIIVLIIILFGLLCVFLAGQWALQFSPRWRLDAGMGPSLDLNNGGRNNRPIEFVEAVDSSILTQPVWKNVYLTPGAVIPTRVPTDTSTPTSIPTSVPVTNTNIPIGTPTSTLVSIPPTRTPTSISASTKTSTPVSINTATPTPVAGNTSTSTPTRTPASTATSTPTSTSTPISTNTSTPTNTPTVSATSTPTSTSTSTPTSTPTNTPSADLQITQNDDGATNYDAGGIPVQYAVIVFNAGQDIANGATVTESITNLIGITWTCTGFGGASCPTASGAGNINETIINFPAGGSLQYIVSATSGSPSNGDLVNTVRVDPPVGITDPNLSNNSMTDRDTLIVANSLPAGNIGNIPAGTYSDFRLSVPLVVGSNSYLIYYPQYSPPASTLEMDWVILQIGDGRNWYTVFYWGDLSPDSNSDVAVPLAVPPNPTDCTGEPDNCLIDLSLLTNPPGVTIALSGVLTPGTTYPYIRIKSPSGDSGDGLDVNTITIVP